MLSIDVVRQAALAVGFDDCGVARADALTDEEYPLREWLCRGWHGDLGYMERNVEMRMDPRLLVPGARSVICCVSAYPPPDSSQNTQNTPSTQNIPNTQIIAAYARHRDYHKDVKQMLFALKARLGIEGKCCCDTVPISDKHWAARAGLGWIGRHTLLVTPRWGSWVNLGEIVTTEEIEDLELKIENYSGAAASSQFSILNSQFHSDFCIRCNRCVEACPNHAIAPLKQSNTQAIKQSYMLDVRRCTAYYTTHTPRPLPPDVDTRGYTLGCDLCQLACPFNKNLSH